MCSALGIRHAYAQDYNHQSTGRAEVAGQQIKENMRKITVEEKVTWVEALPIALDRLHDVKGQGGLSPYEIVTGRTRPLANLPYVPQKDCEDAIQFFARMEGINQKVANTLNEIHEKQTKRVNESKTFWKLLDL